MPILSVKNFLYCCIAAIFTLCTLADFYRNRDPYKAYFHARNDHYLTTHLIDSDFNRECLELESRLSGKTSPYFAEAIEELYSGKQIHLPNTYLISSELLLKATGKEVQIQQLVSNIPDDAVKTLLRQGRYSFFYSPLSFSPLGGNHIIIDINTSSEQCLQYAAPWKSTDFPLLIVLLPPKSPDDFYIKVIQQGKYLFFIPSEHPVVEQI